MCYTPGKNEVVIRSYPEADRNVVSIVFIWLREN